MTPVKKTTKAAEVKKAEETTAAVAMADVKAEVKAEKAAAKKTVKNAAEKAKAETKKAKEETKKVAEKAMEETKKVAEKAKEESKKVAEKAKTETKKAADKVAASAKKVVAPKASVTVEFRGMQYSADEIVEKATKAYKDAHQKVAVKTIEVYVKPEEKCAYYVVNGEGSDDYRIEL